MGTLKFIITSLIFGTIALEVVLDKCSTMLQVEIFEM
jgi:hypothetical protein